MPDNAQMLSSRCPFGKQQRWLALGTPCARRHHHRPSRPIRASPHALALPQLSCSLTSTIPHVSPQRTRTMTKKLLALLAAASAVVAQNNTFLDGLMSTLSDAGASSLTQLAGQLNGSSQGQYLLNAISNGDPYVLFAPNDTAGK